MAIRTPKKVSSLKEMLHPDKFVAQMREVRADKHPLNLKDEIEELKKEEGALSTMIQKIKES